MKKNCGSIPFFAWPIFIILAAIAILLLSVSERPIKVEAPVPPQLYSSSFQLLGTGNKLGTYYPVGHILADWFNSNLETGEEVFKAVETNGSIDNIQLLEEGKITFAIAESRIVQEAFHKSASSSLRVIWPLWPDVVQLVKAPGLENVEISQLDYGFLGQKKSSTYRTACEIFSTLGMNPEKMAINLSPEFVLREVASGKIKFAMIQAGIPNRTVSDAVIFHGCSLVKFPETTLQKLSEKVTTSWRFVIPAGYYGEKQEELETLGIPNVLVANVKTSSATVEFLTDLLSRSASSLKIRHQAIADIPGDAAEAEKVMAGIGVPMHPGTVNWLSKNLDKSAMKTIEKK